MKNILEVKSLQKVYSPNTGIFDINFSIEAGHFHSFIGENGAGKTTTIKSIIGAYNSYSGEILIDGKNSKNPETKNIIGYVPEYAKFPKELTTFTYLQFLAMLNGVSKSVAKEKITALLEKFNISDLKNKKPVNFSSGQKKKILLIQALIHDPQLIILDEPTANLDPTARFELFTILNQLKSQGKTIFISSHVLSEIDKYTDSFTLIHKGQIVYNGKKYKPLEKVFYEKVLSNK